MRRFLYILLASLLMTACYQQEKPKASELEMSNDQKNSADFFNARHYAYDYNFRVKADSLHLVAVPNPAEITHISAVDIKKVEAGDRLVVGSFVVIPSDSIDSVWVQVLRDEETIGWIHEKELLAGASPFNPISLFIDFFSNTHLLIFLAFLVLVVGLYSLRRYRRHNALLVHFNDIASFYPTLLTLLVSSSAVFYSTIQLQAADSWVRFYFHPTLNPFTVPLHIGIFLASVWAIIIVGVATLADIRRYVSPADYLVYFMGLMAVCAVDYVIFSVSTLYYIGYPLLLAYIVFALWRYFRYSWARYVCGNCGKPLRKKGRCPHCGMKNI